MTIVNFNGTDIDFGDTPLSEIREFLAGEQDKIDQEGIDKWLKPLIEAIPDPVDYSPDLNAIGSVLVSIRDLLNKEDRDYSPEFAKLAEAMNGIDIPEPKPVDLGPLLKAVQGIKIPEQKPAEVDMSGIQELLTKILQKEQTVTIEPEKRPVPTGFEIVERDSQGNAKMIEVRY